MQAIPVTPDATETATEREASASRAMNAHKRDCPVRADGYRCQRCTELTAAWREALRELRYAPLNHAPASGQTTTEGATR